MAKGQEKQGKEPIVTEGIAKDESVMYSREAEHAADRIGGTLFRDESAPTETELMGTPPEDAKGGEKETEDAAKKEATEKEATEKEAAEKVSNEEKKVAGEQKEESGGPPPGFVPTAALHEERTKRQRLGEEVGELRTQVAELMEALKERTPEKKSAAEGTVDDAVSAFTKKVAEVEEVFEDDPMGSTKKFAELLKEIPALLKSVKEDGKKEVGAAKEEAADKEKVSKAVSRSLELMESLVPGIFDTAKDVNLSLTKFAYDQGITREFLPLITDPGTKIVAADGKSFMVGDNAAYIVSILKTALEGKGSEEVKKIVLAENESKWKEEIRAAVTKELMAKMGKSGESFKSVLEIPGESPKQKELSSQGRVLTEAEYAKLPVSEKQKYLMG
uniref:Uncharacterized protein n=1 Tax=viral metagenome TaxID=1070528 RepID=A0A6M3ILJ0_9ZZZZ